MPQPQLEAVEMELHAQAEEIARSFVNEYAVSLLIIQAKALAFQRRADLVLSTHIEEARDIIMRAEERTWAKELRLVFGGALLGAFIQGFINEMSVSPLRPFWITVYVLVGFLGSFLIFWGLRD